MCSMTISWPRQWNSWWRHQMETFSALLPICAGNSPVPGELPAQRPMTRSFDVFVDLRLNKRLSKQSWSWWFETQSRPLWRHRNGNKKKGSVSYFSDKLINPVKCISGRNVHRGAQSLPNQFIQVYTRWRCIKDTYLIMSYQMCLPS